MYPPGLLALAVLSGLGFACVGISYRAAHARGLSAIQVALAICVVGTVSFAAAAHGTSPRAVPPVVWALSAAAGAGQYVTLRMVGPALRRGPLSAMWCAVNLNFAMAIGYARLFLHEDISPLGAVGVGAAVVCVVMASLNAEPPVEEKRRARPRRVRLTYGAILLVILFANGLWMTSIKHLSAQSLPDGRSAMQAFGPWFSAAVYLLLGLLLLADTLVARPARLSLRPWLATGALAAVGSVVGMWALATCASLPASVVFTINSVVSLLTAAVVGAAAFSERRTAAWYGTVGLAVVAVALVNAPVVR